MPNSADERLYISRWLSVTNPNVVAIFAAEELADFSSRRGFDVVSCKTLIQFDFQNLIGTFAGLRADGSFSLLGESDGDLPDLLDE